MSDLNTISFFDYMKNDFIETITTYKNWIVEKYQKVSTELRTAYAEYQKTQIKDLTKNTVKIPVRPHLMFYFYKHGSEIFTFILSYFIMIGFFFIALKNVEKFYVMIPLLIFCFVGLVFLTTKLKYYIKRWSK